MKRSRRAIFWKMFTFSLLVLLLGIGFMYWGEQEEVWKGHALWRAVVREIGAMFFTTVAIALVWELAGRHDLVDEVFEIAGISEELKRSGITQATLEPHRKVNWEECFAGTRKLDVLLGWDYSIPEALGSRIGDLAVKNETEIRLLLPKPSSSEALVGLRKNYDRSVFSHTKADVRVADFSPKHSYYIFDRFSVIVLLENGKDKNAPRAAFVAKADGSLYDHSSKEFDQSFMGATPLKDFKVQSA